MSKSVDDKKRVWREDAKEMLVEYAPKLIVATMTGYFTWHAAWFLTESQIMASFTVLLAEGFWFLWQFLRDENAENNAQTKNATVGWWVSIFFVTITDLSSGVFMAHDAGFEYFATIPDWAQIAPAAIIPLMAIIQGVLLAIYTGNSDSRIEFMAVRKAIRDARNTERKARAEADKEIATSNARRTAELARKDAPLIGRQKADNYWEGNYGRVYNEETPDAINPTKPKQSKK